MAALAELLAITANPKRSDAIMAFGPLENALHLSMVLLKLSLKVLPKSNQQLLISSLRSSEPCSLLCWALLCLPELSKPITSGSELFAAFFFFSSIYIYLRISSAVCCLLRGLSRSATKPMFELAWCGFLVCFKS
jgi:hypothetical protein